MWVSLDTKNMWMHGATPTNPCNLEYGVIEFDPYRLKKKIIGYKIDDDRQIVKIIRISALG